MFELGSRKIRKNEVRANGGLGVWGKDSVRPRYCFWPLPARALHDFGESFSNRWRRLPVFWFSRFCATYGKVYRVLITLKCIYIYILYNV